MQNSLGETVIENDYCIGCGACAFTNPEEYSIEFDEYGMYKAARSDEELLTELNRDSKASRASKVCPFSNDSLNEDQLSDEIFSESLSENEYIGKYISCYAGHVVEGEFREMGSSGGFGKWILKELLAKDEVDYVIQVIPVREGDELFSYEVFDHPDEILSGSKSAYNPVTMKESLEYISEHEGRYAITALPCFSKALRSICREDPVLNKRVEYVLGLVCGGLKSRSFAESFAWQLGVHPNDLKEIEFRGEVQAQKANEKGVYAINYDGEKTETVSSRKLLGGDWGHGFFKYKACDYCDDIVGETTDVSFGDAWLDEYIDDTEGSNVIVTRNQRIEELVRKGIQNGNLQFEEIPAEKVAESQMGGIRHRRDGLSYRIKRQIEQGNWVPEKRIEPGSSERDILYKKREELRKISHESFLKAKEEGDYSIFEETMEGELKDYNKIYGNKFTKIVSNILDKIGMKKYGAAIYYRILYYTTNIKDIVLKR